MIRNDSAGSTRQKERETSSRDAGVQLKGRLSVREAGWRAVDRRGQGSGGEEGWGWGWRWVLACQDQPFPLEQPRNVIA